MLPLSHSDFFPQLLAGLRFSVHQQSEMDTSVKFDLQIRRYGNLWVCTSAGKHTGNRLQTTQYHSGIILLPLPHNGLKNKHIELGFLKYRKKCKNICMCISLCSADTCSATEWLWVYSPLLKLIFELWIPSDVNPEFYVFRGWESFRAGNAWGGLSRSNMQGTITAASLKEPEN